MFDGYIDVIGGDARPRAATVEWRPNYRLPDTAYWAPGRPSGDDSVPSVAVEVRSPGQTVRALRDKCRAFRAGGVETCWLIDPAARTPSSSKAMPTRVRLRSSNRRRCPASRVALADLFKVLDR